MRSTCAGGSVNLAGEEGARPSPRTLSLKQDPFLGFAGGEAGGIAPRNVCWGALLAAVPQARQQTQPVPA